MIDKKSKIFFGILITISMISIIATYYRYVLLNDFYIYTDEQLFNESLLEE
jgi:hypothetical protein